MCTCTHLLLGYIQISPKSIMYICQLHVHVPAAAQPTGTFLSLLAGLYIAAHMYNMGLALEERPTVVHVHVHVAATVNSPLCHTSSEQLPPFPLASLCRAGPLGCCTWHGPPWWYSHADGSRQSVCMCVCVSVRVWGTCTLYVAFSDKFRNKIETEKPYLHFMHTQHYVGQISHQDHITV